jgi:hypothetical protein
MASEPQNDQLPAAMPNADGDDPGLRRSDFSEGWVGRASYLIFHYRKSLLWLFVAITIALGWSATRLQVSAGFSTRIRSAGPTRS